MNLFSNISSFLFPFVTKKSVVTGGNTNTKIPVSNNVPIVSPPPVSPIVSPPVSPKETTLFCVRNSGYDSKYIETNNTPVYIVESSNDNHIITSDGTFVNLKDISYVSFDNVYENRFFSGGRTRYFPIVKTRAGFSPYEDYSKSYKIGNREFYDLNSCDKFVDEVTYWINEANLRK